MNELNRYRVIISEQAAQMLVSHTAFLAQTNTNAAERLIASFEEAIKSLEYMPQRCPWLVGDYIPRNAYRSLLLDKRYLIIYQIADNIVYVDYVLDCRQDYKWLLQGR